MAEKEVLTLIAESVNGKKLLFPTFAQNSDLLKISLFVEFCVGLAKVLRTEKSNFRLECTDARNVSPTWRGS